MKFYVTRIFRLWKRLMKFQETSVKENRNVNRTNFVISEDNVSKLGLLNDLFSDK